MIDESIRLGPIIQANLYLFHEELYFILAILDPDVENFSCAANKKPTRLRGWVSPFAIAVSDYFLTSYSASITSSPPSFFSGPGEAVGPAPGAPPPALE